tara:strand:+ start:690 stop:2192 length:1503 start_codon:yes stop_codon:yes gene_type:complete
MDIFQSQRFKSSLKRIGDTTSLLARVMRTDARTIKNDYAEISRLNDRLKRVIPIIPASFGVAGVTFGRGVDENMFPGFPGFFGFGPPGLPGIPPKGPRKGPQTDQQTDTATDTSTATEPETGLVLTGPDGTPVQFPELQQLPPIPVPEKEREGEEALEPALVQTLIKELEERLEQETGITFPEPETPQILPLDDPIAPTEKERELPPPLRLFQSILDFLGLNELARGTTQYVLGKEGSQQKLREILEFTADDQKVAELVVQTFGLSTQLIPIIKIAYTAIPVGPAKFRKFFNIVRFLFNSTRQGNFNLKQLQSDVNRYIKTGSFFKGVPDAQRLQNAGMIRYQGQMRAQGVDRSSPAQTYQNIFGQTEFARKIQQLYGNNNNIFPKFKPIQGDGGFPLVQFDVRNFGTMVPTKEIKIPIYLEKLQTQGTKFFNRNPIPKKGDTKVELKPGDIRSQIERSGGFEDDLGNFYIFRDTTTPVGPQASSKVRIKPIYILTDQIA